MFFGLCSLEQSMTLCSTRGKAIAHKQTASFGNLTEATWLKGVLEAFCILGRICYKSASDK